jgi:hypothetical protein
LTGYAWSSNYGWINLSPSTAGVMNNGNGVLSGYAWGENTAWIDFSGVTIDTAGFFNGYANGNITGQISFNCANTSSCSSSDFKVRTDWRPKSVRPECNNGLDDDADGLIDYPNDLGCSSLEDTSETQTEGSGGGGGGGGATFIIYQPKIISNNGSAQANISVNENETFVTIVEGSSSRGTLKYSILSGNDLDKFKINAETGKLEFNFYPAFENPKDSDKNNIYEVIVKVENSSHSIPLYDTQKIFVNILDIEAEDNLHQSAEDFFNDISGHWAEIYINKLHQAGVNGYTDAEGKPLHLFGPDNIITRAELIVLLMKVKFGILPEITIDPYIDVPATHWSASYVAKAKELGIVKGYADGSFGLNNNASRAEALKMILLTWFSPETISISSANTICNDIVQSEWYAEYFNFALNESIVGGYKDENGNLTGLCGPDKNSTRAELAKITILTEDQATVR